MTPVPWIAAGASRHAETIAQGRARRTEGLDERAPRSGADALAETAAQRDAIQAAVGGDQDKLTAAEKRSLPSSRRRSASTRHFDKFAELAKEAKAKPGALKHLWEVSKYEAKDDEPDAKALGKMVAELRKSTTTRSRPRSPPRSRRRLTQTHAGPWRGAARSSGIVPGQTPEPAGGAVRSQQRRGRHT